MAVSPDFLLQTSTLDARPKAPARTSEASREPADNGRSSFSDVYARERQAKPAERPAAPARREADKPSETREAAKGGSAEKPTVAESGKPLPADEQPSPDEPVAEGELDPLLLFGLGGGQLPVEDAASETAEDAASDVLTEPEGLFASPTLQAPVLTDAGAPEGEAALNVGLQVDAQGKKAMVPGGVQPADLSAGTGEAVEAESVFEEAALKGETTPEEQAGSFAELLESAEGPKESRQSAGEPNAPRFSAAAAQVANPQPVAQAARPMLVPGQPVQMHQAGWSEAVADRVMWLSSQNLQSAEIQLDPAELGRMEVRIDMNRDQAQITFLSPHAGVRDALEGQMQRLRDMFDQQGLGLMNVNVSDQSLSRGWQGREQGEATAGRGGAGGAAADDSEVVLGSSEISANRAAGNRGLVDYYA
ncbi:flagellar hook-length control protein FliK [Stutzerimonas balearica]|uniref:flagellar hook-length control protein FliK n=1 Tax=Stutzerimonas balearica TaxID=74829 RepID=UPI0028965172|nr:flagellar hook-length control protein FliK [Stutzerimonas balearica]